MLVLSRCDSSSERQIAGVMDPQLEAAEAVLQPPPSVPSTYKHNDSITYHRCALQGKTRGWEVMSVVVSWLHVL